MISSKYENSTNNEQFRPNENGSHYTIYNYFFIPI